MLDQGEAQAIALAVELKAERLIVDERRARQVAHKLGVRTVGVLAVLVESKHRGLVPLVSPLLTELADKIQFRTSAELREHILRAANEL
jgi:predicted nucleic acid-binding protein